MTNFMLFVNDLYLEIKKNYNKRDIYFYIKNDKNIKKDKFCRINFLTSASEKYSNKIKSSQKKKLPSVAFD